MDPHVLVYFTGALPGPEAVGKAPERRAWILGVGLGCVLLVAHTTVLGILPIHIAVEYQLPPASCCVLVFEQVWAGPMMGWGGAGEIQREVEALARVGTPYSIGGAELVTRGGVRCKGFKRTSGLQGNVNKMDWAT